MTHLIVAAVQIACVDNVEANLAKLEQHVREAARRGARLAVLQELFEGPYFCQDIDKAQFARARPFADHPTVTWATKLAKDNGIVLPVSFFERDGNKCFNSLAMIDANGKVLGLY